jgi:hypothetical protein
MSEQAGGGTRRRVDERVLRAALLELHRELLHAQRIQTERFGGRMSAAEVLQAAADDLRFDWLRTLSQSMADLDEAIGEEPERVAAAVGRIRGLLAPPDPDTPFGARYLQALQDHPEVVMAHRAVTAALEA